MKRGFAIILVLATLVLLAMLSITYIKLALIDRNIARNYMDNKRAKLIAQSGVEYAIGRLNSIINTGWFKNGKLTDEEWIYDPETKRPSFAYSQAITINGRSEQFTSTMASSTYGKNSDIFRLKVIDTQSQININDGVKISNTHYTSRNLQRILNILGMQLSPPVSGLGDKIIENRPLGGYSSKQEIARILGDNDYLKIKDFITTNSWTNDSVAIPVPLSDYSPTVTDSYPFFSAIARPTDSATNQKIYRYGHNLNWKGDIISNDPNPWKSKLIFGDPWETTKIHGVYSTDALNPQWIELTQRSPVNINTASPEVLKALIIDLEGFFVMERRTPNPPVPTKFVSSYLNMPIKYTYDKDSWDRETNHATADELGYIYKTIPYSGTGGRNASGIDANLIVEQIISCRRREGSYSSVNYGGPFKSWAQFNIFVDKLVENSLIIDNRSYFDLESSTTQVVSYIQTRLASIAAGDVLKANFNPNLHLNELNPDRQLFIMVDKTDLIVNSTEFCFTPMGCFEISSEGYILIPQGSKDSLIASNNQVIASERIEAVIKLYDIYYETSQNEFYQGTFSNRMAVLNSCTTNNSYSIETGPEPDNGSAIAETEYDGYIRLSTNLGCFSNSTKKKKELWTTDTTGAYGISNVAPVGSAPEGYDASIHSHFQLDHVAHYHQLGATAALPMGSIRTYTSPDPPTTGNLDRYNFPDKSETRRSPYSPVDGSKYRLCRSFRSSESEPSGYLYAPSDLRLDGVFVEPHSAFGYDINFTTDAVVAFWIKPNWFPELGGRTRTFTSMRKYRPLYSNDSFVEWPLPYDVLFLPRHPTRICTDYIDASTRGYNRLTLFVASCEVGEGGGSGMAVGSIVLNHEFETSTENWDRFTGNDGKFNHIRGREWAFIIARFYIDTIPSPPCSNIDIRVNNQSSSKVYWRLGGVVNNIPFAGPYIVIGGDFSSYCATNRIDIAHSTGSTESYCNRIFYADSTMDEFFFWADKTDAVAKAQDIWQLGRYYRPVDLVLDSLMRDAVFTSQEISFSFENKLLQNESAIIPPADNGSVVSYAQSNNFEILGIAWTYYAEDYLTTTETDGTPRLKPVVWDWKNLGNGIDPPNVDINIRDARSLCCIRLNINGTDYPTGSMRSHDNDAYSVVNKTVSRSDIIRYKVKFRVGPGITLDTVLLASPIFDDITIYYTDGVKFLSYSYFD